VSQGIYKITNLVTSHAYVGQSVRIEDRLKSHFSEAKLFNKDSIEYSKALYVAIRKYGKDAFKTEILELVEAVEDLNSREIYWITFYNTYNNGYNMTPGGGGFHDNAGEKHPNHKVTAAEVKDIRIRYAAKTESILDIYFDYEERIGYAGFKKIYTWQTWKNILPELYTA
jgi:group I intron endonuclease